jgi:hypothetical protein
MGKEREMKRMGLAVVMALFLATAVSLAHAEPYRRERREHPRIAKAIAALHDAIAYMEHAPHDFGGHKAAAISASHEAIAQLQQALEYRARHDH